MNKVTAIIMGFGDRGQIYASYAKKCPESFSIVGVVDPDIKKLKKAKREYGVSDSLCFSNCNDFFARGKLADVVINATMDSLHYKTTVPLLENGYHVLLEKPITSDINQLNSLANIAKKHDRHLMICHVLRYAPFYAKIKDIILSEEIGAIKHIYAAENVAIYHMLSAYVRGKWNSESECGSGMLMAKCCHDLDLICWLNAKTAPKQVVSLGVRSEFIEENKPIGAGERCLTDCKVQLTCPYSAKKLYIDNDIYPFLIWNDLKDKDWDSVDIATRIELLKTTNPHGLCAYKHKDLVDSQSVLVTFDNGSTATLTMTGGVARPGRTIHIVGKMGEIEGFLEENKFIVRTYNMDKTTYNERTIKIDEDVSGAHSGGDLRLVEDFVALVSNQNPSVSCTSIDDSIVGHILTIKAEQSRKTAKVVVIS